MIIIFTYLYCAVCCEICQLYETRHDTHKWNKIKTQLKKITLSNIKSFANFYVNNIQPSNRLPSMTHSYENRVLI